MVTREASSLYTSHGVQRRGFFISKIEKDELEKKIEIARQRELIRTTSASWLIFMAREDSSSKPIRDLNKKGTQPKLRDNSEENKTWHDDGP